MRSVWRRIVELLFAGRLDRDSADELSHHVESVVVEKMRCGIDEPEARRQARIELGSIRTTRERLAEGPRASQSNS